MLWAMWREPCAWAKGVVPNGVDSKGNGLSAQLGKGEGEASLVSVSAVMVVVVIV